MVKEPIEQSGGKDLVAEQASPLGKAGIGGQNDRSMLIPRRDQFKEVASLLLRQFGVANLIDDQQTGHNLAAQALPLESRVRSTL